MIHNVYLYISEYSKFLNLHHDDRIEFTGQIVQVCKDDNLIFYIVRDSSKINNSIQCIGLNENNVDIVIGNMVHIRGSITIQDHELNNFEYAFCTIVCIEIIIEDIEILND